VVLEYQQGAVAAMAALQPNSTGDRDAFVAGKYSFGAASVMAACDDSHSFDNSSKSRATMLRDSYLMGRTTLKLGYGHQRLNAGTNHFASLGADYLSRAAFPVIGEESFS
jgi:hypothetical protein